MKKSLTGIRLSASDLSNHLACRHLTALDIHVATGSRSAPAWNSPDAQILQERGIAHEEAYVEHLKSAGLAAVSFRAFGNDDSLVAETLVAMQAGVDVIVQAAFGDKDWFGRPDVLRKVDRPSALGDWSYEVYDCKLAHETKAATILQLSLYSHLLGTAQGLRGLPEGSCLYQYTRVMSGFDLPRQKQYANEVTETFASDRLAHLDRTAAFRRIDLHWCLTLEPSKAKAFERKPQENAIDTSRMLSDLEKTATLLEGHLGSSLGLRLLGKAEVFQFFSYLFNLEEWASRDELRSDTGVDRQIVNSPVAWHSDHVQIGKRHVQMFSLKTTPEASRPCLFSGLLTLDCDSVLCSTWRVKSTSAARSEIDAQEKFISFFKVGVLTRVMSGRDSASLDTGAGAKAANNNVDDLSEVIRSLDKKAQGEFSLRLLLAARSAEQLRDIVPAVHRVFVDARAQVMEETLGNLSAFYAMFPGNHKFNVFPLWLAEDHYARFTEEEHRDLLRAARSDGRALGEWAREILLREARRSADDALFTELIATRMILLNLLKPLAMGQVVTPEDFTRISATVRSDKRKVAQEIQQQYTKATPKEL